MERKLIKKMPENESICFIGSTLPISFIVENHIKLNIKKIFVANQKLAKSTKFIHNKINKQLEIKSLPKNKICQFFSLIIIFLKIKLKSKKVILFHEISWIIFDIAFHLIKPNYKFFPQVTLNSYSSIEKIDTNKIKSKDKKLLIINKFLNFFFKLRILPRFKLLFIESDNSNFSKINYVGSFSCQEYKVSKITNKIKKSEKAHKKSEGRIVMLCGIDVGSKNEQQIITNKIVKLIKSKGIKIDVKGHPNWENIYPDNKFKDINYIDKYLPFEILDDNEYISIIGFGSTILSRYPYRSISLLKLIKSIPKYHTEKKIIHLKSLHKKNECLYPNSENEVSEHIDFLVEKYYS